EARERCSREVPDRAELEDRDDVGDLWRVRAHRDDLDARARAVSRPDAASDVLAADPPVGGAPLVERDLVSSDRAMSDHGLPVAAVHVRQRAMGTPGDE